MEQVIFLTGNLSEGFTAHGPYEDWDEAFAAHETDEGWGMTLSPVKSVEAKENNNGR